MADLTPEETAQNLDTSIGGAADRAWFADQRKRIHDTQMRALTEQPGPVTEGELAVELWGIRDAHVLAPCSANTPSPTSPRRTTVDDFPESLVDAAWTATDDGGLLSESPRVTRTDARAATVAVLRALVQQADRMDALAILRGSLSGWADELDRTEDPSKDLIGTVAEKYDKVWVKTDTDTWVMLGGFGTSSNTGMRGRVVTGTIAKAPATQTPAPCPEFKNLGNGQLLHCTIPAEPAHNHHEARHAGETVTWI